MIVYLLYALAICGFYTYLKMNNSRDLFGDPDENNAAAVAEEEESVDLDETGDKLGLNLSGIDINPNEMSGFMGPADTSNLIAEEEDMSRIQSLKKKAIQVKSAREEVEAAVDHLVELQKRRGMPEKMFGAR